MICGIHVGVQAIGATEKQLLMRNIVGFCPEHKLLPLLKKASGIRILDLGWIPDHCLHDANWSNIVRIFVRYVVAICCTCWLLQPSRHSANCDELCALQQRAHIETGRH